MKKYEIFVPLPDIRPNWLRKIICILYFPIVTPIILAFFLVFIIFGLSKYGMVTEFKAIRDSFYVACWTGNDIDYSDCIIKYSK